jgi:hypothetical protein
MYGATLFLLIDSCELNVFIITCVLAMTHSIYNTIFARANFLYPHHKLHLRDA